MGAPIIGITTYGRDEKNRFTLYADYVDSIRRAGGIPLLVPPGEPRLDDCLQMIDALVLPGGGDLDPVLYGGRRLDGNYMIDAERDETELALTRAALETHLPCLCICRGMQLLNVALGGTLIEHIADEVGEAVVHVEPPREPVRHAVLVGAGTRLAEIVGEREIDPLSWHHQAIRDLAPGLEVVARAPDGVIEAVELASHPWLVAVQWHPELSAAEETTQQRLFDAVVEQARKERER